MLETLDLRFLGVERGIASYLVDTDDGPALHDCGPATTLPRLREAIAEHGLELRDIRHLLLSHIHFDHAGAVGPILREHPDLTVWVSPVGVRHLVDPSRLEASARRLYGADFDRLWGELAPVPEQNIRIAEGNAVGWEAFATPGHASHHVAYFRDGTLLGGDVCGIRAQPGRYVLPISPPPDIDLEAWFASIDAVAQHAPERLALTHFGVATDVNWHLQRLRETLTSWGEWVGGGMERDAFVALARPQAGDDAAKLYDPVDQFGQSWQGLRRYWDKREAV